MTKFYELGVKLALDNMGQTNFNTQSSSASGSVSKVKMPKPPKPKLPPKSSLTPEPTTAPPRPAPTRAINTGPWGMRYGGRGVSAREIGT